MVTAAVFYGQVLAALTPARAWARVDPLNRIVRQIHKPNMLILFDTSGSLTGVPGGTFDYSKEVGVDCDDGIDCRGGTSTGMCTGSGKVCASDDGCGSGTCSSGYASCGSNSDCPPIAGTCSTGQSCFADADCPVLTTGKCAGSGTVCDPSKPCVSKMTCRYDDHPCTPTSNDCRRGICSDNVNSCNTSDDCPYATRGGTCTFGTTPTGGCSTSANCPVAAKVCSDNSARPCTTVNDCGGTCKATGTACTSDATCKSKSTDYCDFSGKTCSSPTNSCILSRLPCSVVYNDNGCIERNACIPGPNPCTGVTSNSCLPGVSGDTCRITKANGYSLMCRIGQTLCTSDASCSMSGDSCGPASSRMTIAKRVIRNVIAANANVVNLGLMTFYQAGYFPYFVVGSGTTTTTKSVDVKQGTLEAAKCYTKKTGLATTCTIDGQIYQLRAGNNARYLIKGNGDGQDKYVDAPYCGWFCAIPGVGTGVFKGGYYQYKDVQGTVTQQVNFPTYMGKVFTKDGVTYRYYDSRPDYYNGGASPPIQVANCGNSCSATCGGRWDTQLAPFLTTVDTQENIDAVVTAFNQALEPASLGGLIAYGGAPTGCALDNDGAQDVNHSAYSYMKAVKAADTLPCRLNYIVFVADGESNGPGDVSCTSPACSADDPLAAGCTCRAVLSAFKLRQEQSVKTFVVGFSDDATTGVGRIINENIARAGGTDSGNDGQPPYAFSARNEEQLNAALQQVVFAAAMGSYSTTPATASQGTSQGTVEQSGTYMLDSRVDFPSWQGHLLAYDISGAAPVLAWDAATKLAGGDWRKRRVYTADGADTLVPIDVDPATGTIRNADKLYALGLGASADEAGKIGRWMLGDPALKNPAVLGSIINSTPIDVGPAPDGTLPGQHAFYLNNLNRPPITYVGSDDGMLHAFYTRSSTIGGVTVTAGTEAFAFVPRSMLTIVTKLFAQGGQLADPAQHIYGLASSPKVKSVCTSKCTADDAVWTTELVMTHGWGGNGLFMLDITNPTAAQPFRLLWSTSTRNESATYDADLGLTVSVPAFTFVPSTTMNDYRLIFTSGYPVNDTSTSQGRYVVSASSLDGSLLSQAPVASSGGCSQEYTLLTDVATSRRQQRDSTGVATGRKEFLAGYYGDTWGNLWQYTVSRGTSLVFAFGCGQPLHVSPTVVQMDADDPNNAYAGQVYLVQVTNSSLDKVTDAFAPSKMVVMKQTYATGVPTIDTTFGTSGKVELTTTDSKQMCAVTNASGTTCITPLPATARPMATPTGILKLDGTGFVTLSTWYAAPTDGCGKGATYLLVHDFSGSNVILKQALKIADEPVVNPIIVNGSLMISSSNGPISVSGSMALKVESAVQPLSSAGDAFQMMGWSEIE